MSKNNLIENRDKFPPEIKRFYIPKRSLKKLIGVKIGGPVNLVDTDKDGIQISIPYPIFEEKLENRYKDDIKSLKINNGKVTINITEEKNEKKKKPEKETNESKFKNIFRLS